VTLATTRAVVGGLPWIAVRLPLARREVLGGQEEGEAARTGAVPVLGQAFRMVHGLKGVEGQEGLGRLGETGVATGR